MSRMPEDPLRSAIEAISRHLQAEVEAQLTQLNARQQEEIDTARRTAGADADARWASRIEAVRDEWTARLESEVALARSEGERRMVAESARLQAEAEQTAAQSTARLREELERAREEALEHERDGATAQLSTERQQFSTARTDLQAELETSATRIHGLEEEIDGLLALRLQADSALEEERRARGEDAKRHEQTAADLADVHVTERQVQLAIVERMLAAIRSMDAARSLSDVLATLVRAAGAEAPRVALLVVAGAELRGWNVEGFGGAASSVQVPVDDAGLLGEVIRRGEPVATADGAGPLPPAFAALPADRAAIAVPLLVGAQPVAVLYADDGAEGARVVPASWPEAIQILGRHASVTLAHLTAVRAADAMRRSLAASPPAPPGAPAVRHGAAPPHEDGTSARRYARLLVSEIKLYHEAAVRIGRQERNLLERLKPEIERARRLYEDRISSSVDSRAALFQQELILILADGDPALLGGPV